MGLRAVTSAAWHKRYPRCRSRGTGHFSYGRNDRGVTKQHAFMLKVDTGGRIPILAGGPERLCSMSQSGLDSNVAQKRARGSRNVNGILYVAIFRARRARLVAHYRPVGLSGRPI